MLMRSQLVFCACSVLACASPQYGATDASLARARNITPQGAALFAKNCANCHGDNGQGKTSAPPLLGPDALPEYPRERSVNVGPASGDPEALRLQARSRPAGAPWRDPFGSASDLYRYVSRNMPPGPEQRDALTSKNYWELITFMLLSRGVTVPPEGVTEANADGLKL
jgi:mono/diheme cytochrome c family protein